MRRRRFNLSAAGLPLCVSRFVSGGMLSPHLNASATWNESNHHPTETAADVVIVGGGTGGAAAALAAARNGLSVLMTEPTNWIGGQMTSQAVPPDENAWIESFGCTRSYRTFRDGLREFYRRHFPLTETARGQKHLNPGGGGVSRICCEPRIAVAVLEQMLAPHRSSGRIQILFGCEPVSADVERDQVRSVTVERTTDRRRATLVGKYFLDATELGDLLPLTGAEYVSGAESQAQTGEKHAAAKADPDNVQSFTWCFPVEYVDGGNFVIDKPRDWLFWRDYVPKLTPPWTGKLLDWTATHPVTLAARKQDFDPKRETKGWWLYRRIRNKANFKPGTPGGSISLVNWPQNDYWLGNIIDKPADVVAKHLEASKQLSLSLLYWMQTEAPRPDGGIGWPGLRLRPDIVDTDDGLAKAAYIRESRRIRARFTVKEQHVGLEMRRRPGQKDAEVEAEKFADSVGIGHYRIDLHPSSAGDNYIDIASLPFQIPLGSLIPVRMRNLLPACKNLGVTHITNGCYRLHPVEWNIGESAALLAAHCMRRNLDPIAVHDRVRERAAYQELLSDQGVELDWPKGHRLGSR